MMAGSGFSSSGRPGGGGVSALYLRVECLADLDLRVEGSFESRERGGGEACTYLADKLAGGLAGSSSSKSLVSEDPEWASIKGGREGGREGGMPDEGRTGGDGVLRDKLART